MRPLGRPVALLSIAALLWAPCAESANIVARAGTVRATVPVVPAFGSIGASLNGSASAALSPASLTPSLSFSAPNVGHAVPLGTVVPARPIDAVPAQAAQAASPFKAAVSVPSALSAPAAQEGPRNASQSLDVIGADAAKLSVSVSQPGASAGELKTQAAFDAPSVRRGDVGDVPVQTGFGAFRQAPRLAPVSSLLPNDAPRPDPSAPQPASGFAARWEKWTQNLTDFAALPFLALQAPQIWANVVNLLGGHPEALANLPWIGYSTGILGNMLLLGWFASQKEKSPSRVQAIGVATSAVVVVQIFLSGHMPALAFFTVMPAIVAGLALNYLKFKDKGDKAWTFWSKATSLLGLVILPQVLWTTFAPAALASFWPAAVAGALGLALTYLDSKGLLKGRLKSVWGNLGAWTATLLFMYGPIAQLMANLANPAGMAGIAIGTLFLAMAGNMLMLPRAMHTKNHIWFIGSAWGVVMGGWAVLLTMMLAGFASPAPFWAATVAIPAWLGTAYALSRFSRR